MKKLLAVIAFVCLGLSAFGQNLTTISGSNLTDINGTKLAAGQVCFLITDQSDNPISVSIGGGGQALKRGYCSPVAAGVVTTFTVPNPSATSPSGIYYRVTVKDSSTGQEVLRYTLVSFTGATFNFDNYAPTNLAQGAPLSGTTVSGNLSGNGNATFTGTVTGSNIPSSILQQIFSSGVGQTQRTAFNMMAGLTCSDNAGTSRTDCRLGTLTTVTFSATPTFDASTASTFKLTLTANVTSSTLSNAVAGEPLAFEICQDATGGRTFVPPTNVQNWVTIPSAANACILETFVYDGTNALADQDVAGGVLAADGAAASPSITFASHNNTGFGNIPGFAAPFVSVNGAYKAFWISSEHRLSSAEVICWSSGSDPSLAAGDTCLSRSSGGVVQAGTSATPNSAGELDARTIGITGSTSGKTSLVTDATASGTATVKAGTYNVVGDSLTQTLTNKTLTSPSTTGTDSGTETLTNKTFSGTTPYNRIRANQGTALVTGDVGSLTNFGTTASVSAVSGTDSAGNISIASAGTGQVANGSFVLTFHDGTWTTAPVCIGNRAEGNGPNAAPVATSTSATTLSIIFNGTATAGVTYSFNFICVGK